VSGVFGVFGDVEFDVGGGTSGDELGIDGDVGEVGVCCAQPAAIALSAMTARVDLIAFILHSSIEREKRERKIDAGYPPTLTPALAAIA
jgi:hypothetical protein